MADFAYSQADMDTAEEFPAGRVQAFIQAVGGVVSLVLIAGLVIWGWQLLVRDVSGVPVVAALEGPMRIEPEDRGGIERDHQGLSVNRISEGREAAPAADRIVLAPPPVDLAETPPPPRATAAAPAEAPAPAEMAMADPADEVAAPLTRPEDEATEEVAAAPRPDPAAAPTPEAASEATLALIDQLMEEEAAIAAAPDIDVISRSISGVRTSRVPPARPAALELAAVRQTSASQPVATPVEIDASSLPVGTRLVQLGAFDDPDTARQEWIRLAEAYPDYFDGRSRIVQQATSGGREFYRLRAHGFDDLMDARRFCTALLADGTDCISVTVR
ncbi:SPOR domain-containing protein [Rhodobacterales bacterium HKCCE3408]|nr:SPOR domain-containing protein [Rhodobacterales bacterium HKCCE3408]